MNAMRDQREPDDQTMEQVAQHMEAEAEKLRRLRDQFRRAGDRALAEAYGDQAQGFVKAAQILREDANTEPNRG